MTLTDNARLRAALQELAAGPEPDPPPAVPPVRQTVYLPRELVKALKHRGVEEERSLSALVAEAVRAYLERPADPA